LIVTRPLFALLLAGCAAILAVPAASEPTPQREGVVHFGEIGDPTQWPLSAIGTVRGVRGLSRLKQCTGTLVGPRLVLTAAHCVYFDDKLLQPDHVHFLAGLNKGEPGAHSVAARLDVAPDYVPREHPLDREAANDWALITLQDAIPVKPVAVRALEPAAFRVIADKSAAIQAGYGKDRPYLPSVSRNCAIKPGADGGTFVYSCLLNFGYSGAPILADVEGEPVVIGIGSMARLAADKTPILGIACSATQFAPSVKAELGKP
jgi:V8-like Glu-specific endopeptidase